MHRGIRFLVVRDLSKDWGSVICGLNTASCLPVLSLTWLYSLDMLQTIELAFDGWPL